MEKDFYPEDSKQNSSQGGPCSQPFSELDSAEPSPMQSTEPHFKQAIQACTTEPMKTHAETLTTEPVKDDAEALEADLIELDPADLNPGQRFLLWLGLTFKDLMIMILGNFTMAFALVNIHLQVNITEGGAIGLAILIHRLTGLNLAAISFVLDASLYTLGYFLLRGHFLKKAILSTTIYSASYALLLELGPVLPSLANHPVWAAIAGGLLLGSGCGLVVTRGGAAGGDDCFALIVNRYTGLSLSQAYFISDFVVLMVEYFIFLPLPNLLCSLLTTFISSVTVGQLEVRLPKPALPHWEEEEDREQQAF